MSTISKSYSFFVRSANHLQPLVLLLFRVWIARVFFLSGLVKNNDWGSTLSLFATEYKVPVLPPYFAAVSSTCFELCCPVLLTLGLGTRLATLPLLAMTAVIQFTYDQNIQHAYWAMLLAAILAFGPGLFSLDHFLKTERK